MATKHHLKKEDDLEEETDELKDSEIAEMGEEGILMPKNPEDMEEPDDTKSEEVTEEEEEE